MGECSWTRKVCETLRGQNALVYPLVGNAFAPAGWPDRYVAHRYWNGFLEFKGDNTKVELHQQDVICELRKHGVSVWVVRRGNNDDDVIRIENETGALFFYTTPNKLLQALRDNGSTV